MALLGMTKEELTTAVTKLYGLLCEGKSDQEAAEALGLTDDQFVKLKGALFQRKMEGLVSRTKEEIFLEYILDQKTCLKKLDVLDPDLKTGNQLSAAVGSVRLRSDIFKEVLRAGQELGIIVRAPMHTKKHVVAGVIFADMTPDQLRTAIARELTNVEELVTKFGERDILDMEPGSIHRPALPPPPMKAATGKTQKANRTKRATSRPVKKRKV